MISKRLQAITLAMATWAIPFIGQAEITMDTEVDRVTAVVAIALEDGSTAKALCVYLETLSKMTNMVCGASDDSESANALLFEHAAPTAGLVTPVHSETTTPREFFENVDSYIAWLNSLLAQPSSEGLAANGASLALPLVGQQPRQSVSLAFGVSGVVTVTKNLGNAIRRAARAEYIQDVVGAIFRTGRRSKRKIRIEVDPPDIGSTKGPVMWIENVSTGVRIPLRLDPDSLPKKFQAEFELADDVRRLLNQ